ncbi:MAG: hypothetical protein CSA58_05615 [Micrococcales bacterium]|nr:MAG: hypothetical protein CSB46_04020 [Micrococcales bacterium]PIE27187.1 MAG: hypothetical protein CSA58_05615 [Micrococcales bacterium]
MVRGIDRFVLVLLGVILLVLGGLAVIWALELFDFGTQYQAVVFTPLQDTLQRGWWPWAAAVAGLVLLVVSLAWLMAHAPQGGSKEVRIAGSGSGGRFTVNVVPLLNAAVETLRRHPNVESVHARMHDRDNMLLADFDVEMHPTGDVTSVTQAAARTGRELSVVLGRTDLQTRFMVKTSGDSAPRQLETSAST